MEDTLRAITSTVTVANLGLNPCFNGRYSQSSMLRHNKLQDMS